MERVEGGWEPISTCGYYVAVKFAFKLTGFSFGAFAGLGKFSVPMVVRLAGLGKPSIWICVGETVEFTVCRQICSSSKLSRSER
jgi:hypothetical protein